MEEILARQKLEKKQLQGEITGLKKTITKKNKKEIQQKIKDLENELNKRHQKELKTFHSEHGDNGDEGKIPVPVPSPGDEHELSPDELLKLSIKDHDEGAKPGDTNDVTLAPPKVKRNRQKERLAKRNAKIQQMKDEAKEESEGMIDYRTIEIDTMNQLLALNQLKIHEIPADGNCLFNSIIDQLQLHHHENLTVSELRQKASDYILSHADDFIPFLLEHDELLTIEQYCEKLTTTTMWGSDIEVLAFSKIFNCPIEVYLVGAEKLKFNEDGDDATLKIAFYKHNYGLGEHYNSLRDVN